LGELSNDIARGVIFTNIILGRPIAGIKNSRASGYGTSNLSCALPDDLREVGISWVFGIVVRNFSRPKVHAILERKVAGASSQIFSIRSKGTPGMFELATVRPLLSLSTEFVAPGEGCRSMLTPNSVMGLEVCLYSSI